MIASLPNVLTFFRIAAIPVLVALFFVEGPAAAWCAFAIYVLAALTDYFDGLAARYFGTVSPLGRLMDPIADKMLVSACLFLLVAFDRVGSAGVIAALLILLREVMIAGMREYLAGLGAAGLPVSPWAKWKTALQMSAIGALVLGPPGDVLVPHLTVIGESGLVLAAGLTVVTGWAYVTRCVEQVARASSPLPKGHNPEPQSTN